jgi:hypothetical protein
MSSFKDAIKNGMTEYLDELKQKLDGLTEAESRWQASLDSNSIQWLVWHMARVEDSWINNKLRVAKAFGIPVVGRRKQGSHTIIRDTDRAPMTCEPCPMAICLT